VWPTRRSVVRMINRHRTFRIAGLMTFVAITLAVASILHLIGSDFGAGIAEALICVALVGGATALRRSPSQGRPAALGATAFAVFGFLVGLTFTARGGEAADLAYHVTMLPVLVWTLILIVRAPRQVAG
jgi:hypothetical protein